MDAFLGDVLTRHPQDKEGILQVITLACGGPIKDITDPKWPVLCISENLAKAMLRDEVINIQGKLYIHPDHHEVQICEFQMTIADRRQTQRLVTNRFVAYCTFYWDKDGTN